MPPTDPLLYRLYEVLLVFGQPIKAVIHEASYRNKHLTSDRLMDQPWQKFGDGIMSAIVSDL